jgi:hypothetical protein
MLEMVDLVCRVGGDEFQTRYWLECLRVNTGDENIVGLIYWPGDYFGDGNDRREMTPSEILATALKAGGKRLD